MTNTLEHALRSLVRAIRLQSDATPMSDYTMDSLREAEKVLPPVPRQFPKDDGDELVYVFCESYRSGNSWLNTPRGTFGPITERISLKRKDAACYGTDFYKLIPVGQTPPVTLLSANLSEAEKGAVVTLNALGRAKDLANGGLVSLLLLDLHFQASELAAHINAVKQAQQREEEKF